MGGKTVKKRPSEKKTLSTISKKTKIKSPSPSPSLSRTTIESLLKKIFGEKYRIEYEPSFPNMYSVYISEKRCVQFSIHLDKAPPEIHIDYLDNCRPMDETEAKIGTGSHTIQLLIDFTRELRKIKGFEHTELIVKIDASRLYIHGNAFPLNVLYVLTKGMSWYNSLGFYENNYETNYENSLTYINQSMSGIRPKKEIQKNIQCGKTDTIQKCFLSIFDRIKLLSNKDKIDSEEQAELNYYKKLLQGQEKYMRDVLFPIGENRYKLLDLKYRF